VLNDLELSFTERVVVLRYQVDAYHSCLRLVLRFMAQIPDAGDNSGQPEKWPQSLMSAGEYIDLFVHLFIELSLVLLYFFFC